MPTATVAVSLGCLIGGDRDHLLRELRGCLLRAWVIAPDIRSDWRLRLLPAEGEGGRSQLAAAGEAAARLGLPLAADAGGAAESGPLGASHIAAVLRVLEGAAAEPARGREASTEPALGLGASSRPRDGRPSPGAETRPPMLSVTWDRDGRATGLSVAPGGAGGRPVRELADPALSPAGFLEALGSSDAPPLDADAEAVEQLGYWPGQGDAGGSYELRSTRTAELLRILRNGLGQEDLAALVRRRRRRAAKRKAPSRGAPGTAVAACDDEVTSGFSGPWSCAAQTPTARPSLASPTSGSRLRAAAETSAASSGAGGGTARSALLGGSGSFSGTFPGGTTFSTSIPTGATFSACVGGAARAALAPPPGSLGGSRTPSFATGATPRMSKGRAALLVARSTPRRGPAAGPAAGPASTAASRRRPGAAAAVAARAPAGRGAGQPAPGPGPSSERAAAGGARLAAAPPRAPASRGSRERLPSPAPMPPREAAAWLKGELKTLLGSAGGAGTGGGAATLALEDRAGADPADLAAGTGTPAEAGAEPTGDAHPPLLPDGITERIAVLARAAVAAARAWEPDDQGEAGEAAGDGGAEGVGGFAEGGGETGAGDGQAAAAPPGTLEALLRKGPPHSGRALRRLLEDAVGPNDRAEAARAAAFGLLARLSAAEACLPPPAPSRRPAGGRGPPPPASAPACLLPEPAHADLALALDVLAATAPPVPHGARAFFLGSLAPRFRGSLAADLARLATEAWGEDGWPADGDARASLPVGGPPARPESAPARSTAPPVRAQAGRGRVAGTAFEDARARGTGGGAASPEGIRESGRPRGTTRGESAEGGSTQGRGRSADASVGSLPQRQLSSSSLLQSSSGPAPPLPSHLHLRHRNLRQLEKVVRAPPRQAIRRPGKAEKGAAAGDERGSRDLSARWGPGALRDPGGAAAAAAGAAAGPLGSPAGQPGSLAGQPGSLAEEPGSLRTGRETPGWWETGPTLDRSDSDSSDGLDGGANDAAIRGEPSHATPTWLTAASSARSAAGRRGVGPGGGGAVALHPDPPVATPEARRTPERPLPGERRAALGTPPPSPPPALAPGVEAAEPPPLDARPRDRGAAAEPAPSAGAAGGDEGAPPPATGGTGPARAPPPPPRPPSPPPRVGARLRYRLMGTTLECQVVGVSRAPVGREGSWDSMTLVVRVPAFLSRIFSSDPSFVIHQADRKAWEGDLVRDGDWAVEGACDGGGTVAGALDGGGAVEGACDGERAPPEQTRLDGETLGARPGATPLAPAPPLAATAPPAPSFRRRAVPRPSPAPWPPSPGAVLTSPDPGPAFLSPAAAAAEPPSPSPASDLAGLALADVAPTPEARRATFPERTLAAPPRPSASSPETPSGSDGADFAENASPRFGDSPGASPAPRDAAATSAGRSPPSPHATSSGPGALALPSAPSSALRSAAAARAAWLAVLSPTPPPLPARRRSLAGGLATSFAGGEAEPGDRQPGAVAAWAASPVGKAIAEAARLLSPPSPVGVRGWPGQQRLSHPWAATRERVPLAGSEENREPLNRRFSGDTTMQGSSPPGAPASGGSGEENGAGRPRPARITLPANATSRAASTPGPASAGARRRRAPGRSGRPRPPSRAPGAAARRGPGGPATRRTHGLDVLGAHEHNTSLACSRCRAPRRLEPVAGAASPHFVRRCANTSCATRVVGRDTNAARNIAFLAGELLAGRERPAPFSSSLPPLGADRGGGGVASPRAVNREAR